MRSTPFAAVLLACALPAIARAAPEERDSSGMIYVGAGPSDGHEHEKPAADSTIVGQVPRTMRVVYRRVVADGDKTLWYFVEPPGMHAGWIAAAETSATRPVSALVPPKPVPSSGVRDSHLKTATVQTAAARGLDSRAGNVTKQDDQKSLQQFAAFEKHVNVHFDDPEDAKGLYPTATTGRRKPMAAQFREGGK